MSSFITTNQGRKPASAESAIEWLKTVRHFNCQAIINVISTLQAENFAMDDQVKELQEMMRCTDKAISHIPAAPQPPALGGEPEIIGYGQRDSWGNASMCLGEQPGLESLVRLRDHRAHIAPLQAEIEQLKAELAGSEKDSREQIDQVKKAYEFLMLCRQDKTDTAIDAGAMRDANEWLKVAAENLGAALSKPAGSEQV